MHNMLTRCESDIHSYVKNVCLREEKKRNTKKERNELEPLLSEKRDSHHSEHVRAAARRGRRLASHGSQFTMRQS